MANIITISREFGSGGRELGKRLADELGFEYYDREIIEAIAKEINFDEDYIERVLDSGSSLSFPITFGRTFLYTDYAQQNMTALLVAQNKFIFSLAKQEKDFVIVGRSADELLRDFTPFNIFVYADMESKLRRCFSRAESGENLTEREMIKKIKQVDSNRAKQRKLLSDNDWGKKESYHLCINTSGEDIKSLTKQLAGFLKQRYKNG